MLRPSNLASRNHYHLDALAGPVVGLFSPDSCCSFECGSFSDEGAASQTVEPGVRIVLLLSSTFMASDACLTSELVSTTPGSVCRLTCPCNLGKACQLKGKPFYFLCRAFSRRSTSLWSSVTNWAKIFLERVGGKNPE